MILFTFQNRLSLHHPLAKDIRTVYSILGTKLRVGYALRKESTQLRCTGKVFSADDDTSFCFSVATWGGLRKRTNNKKEI